MNRNANISSNNTNGRNQSNGKHAIGASGGFYKTTPIDNNIEGSSVMTEEGLPNLKNVKKNEHKAMIQRLTMYNYTMQNN